MGANDDLHHAAMVARLAWMTPDEKRMFASNLRAHAGRLFKEDEQPGDVVASWLALAAALEKDAGMPAHLDAAAHAAQMQELIEQHERVQRSLWPRGRILIEYAHDDESWHVHSSTLPTDETLKVDAPSLEAALHEVALRLSPTYAHWITTTRRALEGGEIFALLPRPVRGLLRRVYARKLRANKRKFNHHDQRYTELGRSRPTS